MKFIVATSILAPIIFLNVEGVYGQRKPAIVGCLDVGCPVQDGSTDSKCTLVDKTFTLIGLAPVPETTSNLTGISWTEGVAVDNRDNQRIFSTNFYFGMPPDKNLTGTGACAVFFNDISNRLAFPGAPPQTSEGTCEDAMGPQCASALIKRATDMDISGLGTTEACKKLHAAFTENVDPVCANSAPGSKWRGITVRALTGPDAPLTITSSQNLTSNCWPVLPKQNSLALVNSAETPGNDLVETAAFNFFNITPILTVFYPGNGSLVTRTEAQLTCIKTIALGVGDNATRSSGEEGMNAKGAGSLYRPNIATLASLVSVLTWPILFGL